MKKFKLIALFAALLAGICTYQLIKEISKPAETPRTEVVVAAVDIPENTLITAEMITLQPVATEALLPNYLTDPMAVVGMVMKSDVYAGEQIVSNRLIRLGETDDSTTLAYKVSEGKRAITVSVNQISGLSYMIRPGNYLDIILGYSEKEKNAKGEEEEIPASRYMLQNVLVLAVDGTMAKTGAGEYGTLTLEVSPEDALRISIAEMSGSMRMVMRSPLDYSEVEIPYVTFKQIREEGKESGQ